jgi:hypothetical protein
MTSSIQEFQVRTIEGESRLYNSLFGNGGAISKLPSYNNLDKISWFEKSKDSDGKILETDMRFILKRYDDKHSDSSENKMKSLSSDLANCTNLKQEFWIQRDNMLDNTDLYYPSLKLLFEYAERYRQYFSVEILEIEKRIWEIIRKVITNQIMEDFLEHKYNNRHAFLHYEFTEKECDELDKNLSLLKNTIMNLNMIKAVYTWDQFKKKFGHL